MLFITAFSTLITVYFAGHLTDRFGRLGMLGVGCVAISVALASYAIADGIGGWVIQASVLLGFGWGLTYALAPIALTTLISEEQRVRGFAILAIAVMAGFGLSPVLASILMNTGFSLNAAFYINSGLSALSAVSFFTLIKPVHRHAQQSESQIPSRLSFGSVLCILNSPARLPIIMVCIGASVFAGLNNFQTVFADERELNYADYFLVYTITVVIFRLVLARFKGGRNPYLTIAFLQYIMFGSVALFLVIGNNVPLYWLAAFLFGIGYGVSYPMLVAMVARDADNDLLAQTLQFFALSYFVGIFGFPLIAGWLIVEMGTSALLILAALLAGAEATMALIRALSGKSSV
ncbi:MFS transporter [Octadecabacter antarcticus]